MDNLVHYTNSDTPGEFNIGFQTGNTLQPPSIEIVAPVLGSAVTFSVTLPFEILFTQPHRFVLAFIVATYVMLIWKSLLHFIFVHNRITIQPLPQSLHDAIKYLDSPLPRRLRPISRFVKQLLKNIKICLRSGTLVWAVTFIIFLPKTDRGLQFKAFTPVLVQLLTPVLMTVAYALEVSWVAIEHFLIVMWRHLMGNICRYIVLPIITAFGSSLQLQPYSISLSYRFSTILQPLAR